MNPFTYLPTAGDILLVVLATWRLASMLAYERMFEWLRQRAQIDFVDDEGAPITRLGRILSCFWCVTLMVAPLVVWMLVLNMRWLLLFLAASGGAIILQHWSRINRYVEE